MHFIEFVLNELMKLKSSNVPIIKFYQIFFANLSKNVKIEKFFRF